MLEHRCWSRSRGEGDAVSLRISGAFDCRRRQDQGKALAGKSTFNRLELTPENAGSVSRYKLIVAEPHLLEAFIIPESVNSLPKVVLSHTGFGPD